MLRKKQESLSPNAYHYRNSGSPVVYAYDAMGNRTRKVDNGITTGYTLDKLGRTVEERTFVKSPLDSTWIPKSLVSSVYDVVGNRLSVTYPDNRTLTSTYDLRNLRICVLLFRAAASAPSPVARFSLQGDSGRSARLKSMWRAGPRRYKSKQALPHSAGTIERRSDPLTSE